MGLSQVMAGLQTKRTLFAAAAAAAGGGPVAWLVTIETTDGTIVDRLWRGTSPSAALAWTQAQADVRVLRSYRSVTLDELQAMEAAEAAALDGNGREAAPC